MKRFAYLAFLLFAGLSALCGNALAVTITLTSNTSWGNINSGSGSGGQPSSSDDIIVAKGRTLTVDVTNAVCRTLQLGTDSGGSSTAGNGALSFSGSTAKLTVSGVVTFGDINSRTGSISMSSGGTLSAQGFSVTNLSTWTPGTGTVQLTATNTLPASSSFNTFNNLTINGSGTTTTLGQSITVSGTLTLTAGTLAVASNTLTLSGAAIAGTATNLSTTSSSSLVFSGSSSGVSIPSSVTALNRLQINNSNGVTLNGNLTLSGTLTFTSGNITTGGNVLTTANCTTSISQTSGYVVGFLQLTYPSSGGTCTFHIGSSSAYTPISLTVSASAGGTLTACTTSNEHAQIDNNSGIDSTKDANRYWTLGVSGDTLAANVTSYSATFNFIAADLDSAATAANFIASYYAGSSWTLPSSVTSNSTSTVVSSVSGPISIPTDFAVGEASTPACTVPSDLPSGTSCVCDYFGRSSLNPSTINGGNWSVSSSNGTFGSPRIVNPGYLRLTDNSTNVATVATLPGTFPAAGNLIALEFKHYAYKGTTSNPAGADGIALVLSDASITPVAGAYGGSLGYAQKTGINGFAGGWVGIGIDEYGNFSNSTEGRSGGSGTSLVPDAIAVRGSGSGSSATSNYPYLATTNSMSTSIDSPTSTSRPAAQAYRVVVDARCYQLNTADISCNNPSLAKKAQVTVYRDTTGTGTFSSSNKVIDFDAYTVNSSQANVPSNWILSFTGSTGSLVNIHEVQGMRVCAQSISLPPDISIDNTTPSTCSTATAGKPTVTITARKSDGTTDTTYTKTVTLAAKLSTGATSNAVFTLLSGSGTFSSNQYTFSASDKGVATFTLTDTSSQDVYITVTENSSGQSSTYSSAVQYRGTSFSVAKNDTVSADGNVVAGRPHLMKVTRNTGCSTDTTYTGAKSLDGWYTPDDYHPTGASAPKICATAANGTCIPSTGSCTTLSIAAPAVSSTVNNLPSLTFSSGVANFCLVTSDVGKYTVSIRDDVTSTTSPIIGTTPNLTAIPFAVVVSDVKQVGTTTTFNPADNTASGTKFVAAGADFQASVGGYLWNVSSDANYDGIQDGVSLSTLISGGAASHYADTVTLGVSGTTGSFYPTTGVAGTLSNGGISISSGSGTVTNLSYSEVGTFTMTATPSTDYLSSGISLSNANRVFIYAKPADTTTTSKLVGRFYPDHFALSNATATPACVPTDVSLTPFTYMGQQFTTSFKLTAQNAGGGTTQNYTGSYARLALSFSTGAAASSAAFKWGATDGTNDLSSRLTVGDLNSPGWSASWSNGVATVSNFPLTFSRKTVSGSVVPDALGSGVSLGIAPSDSDLVTLVSSALTLDIKDGNGFSKAPTDSSKAMRFGRLKLSNAMGSDKLNLPIPATLEYYNGTAFVTNTDDSCTTISSRNNMGYGTGTGNYFGSLNSTNMPSTKLPSSISFTKGAGKLILSPPTSATALSRGAVTVCVLLNASGNQSCLAATTSAAMPWLQSRWTTSGTGYNDDPFVRATFGVFGSGPIIYIRESY